MSYRLEPCTCIWMPYKLKPVGCKGTVLTHWGRVMHICISLPTIIGSDNGLSPGWCQVIIWTNAAISLIGPLGANFSEILIKIYKFSFKKIHLKMSFGKWGTSCLGLNVLKTRLISDASLDPQIIINIICTYHQNPLTLWKHIWIYSSILIDKIQHCSTNWFVATW